MGILVVLLVVAWGLVLGPAVLQSVGAPSPLDTERMFQRALRALGKRQTGSVLGGRSILVPPKTPYPYGTGPGPLSQRTGRSLRSSAAERRRRNLTYLAMFIIATFLLGLIPALRFLLVINLIADVLLIIYLAAALYLAVWPPPSERALPPVEREAEPRRAAGRF